MNMKDKKDVHEKSPVSQILPGVVSTKSCSVLFDFVVNLPSVLVKSAVPSLVELTI